jgi:hypothetical protein
VVTDFDLIGQSNADEDLGEVAWSERNPRNRFAVRVGDLELGFRSDQATSPRSSSALL